MRRTLGECIELGTDARPKDCRPALTDAISSRTRSCNLVVNARDAMPKAAARSSDPAPAAPTTEAPSVLSSVVDTGAGMPPEVAAKAFEPFFTTKRLGQGTGLGLAQVLRCVEQAGGQARIDCGDRQGHRVVMSFPSMPESVKVTEAAAAARAGEFHGNGRLAMVVEDESAVRDYVAESLRGLGFEVIAVGDAVQALRRLEAGPRSTS